MTQQQTPADIVAQAQALIEKVQQQLADGEQFYRDQGLNPDKVRTVLEEQMGAKERESAHQAFKADMEAVEQEVREEQARRSFNAPASQTIVRRPRAMI